MNMEKTKITDRILTVYDYIIVGGGTAGCVLTNRLSEDQSRTVLLLEAGYDDREFPDIRIPVKYRSMAGGILDWSDRSLPQKHGFKGSFNQEAVLPRGKVLGGTGSLNAMTQYRGTPQDFDLWATMGCDGWSYENVLPYFIKSENCDVPALAKKGLRGTRGSVTVTQCHCSELGDKFVEAGVEMGQKHVDLNSGEPLGVMKLQITTSDGERAHTAETFLRPAMHRENVHIVTHCHVTKILIDDKIARAVQFVRNSGREEVRARREIILSAGTVGSAQLLLLSGVGPREHLESLGILVEADLPVGSYLQDHVTVQGIQFELDQSLYPGGDVFSTENQNRYSSMRSGPIATALAEGVAICKSACQSANDNNAAFEIMCIGVLQDHNSRTKTGMLDEISEAMFPSKEGTCTTGPGITILPIVSHPKSKGTLRLRSVDPFARPLIDPNYLADPDDITILVEAIKTCRRMVDTNAFRSIGARLVDKVLPGYQGTPYTDEYWAEYTKTLTRAMYHLAGTCRMGGADDPKTVTDPELRVKGIAHLRVIDASIMPEVTSGNTNAPTVMIAEKGADLVKGVYGIKH